MEQRILYGFQNNQDEMARKKLFLVCGKSFDAQPFSSEILAHTKKRFSGFQANPLYVDCIAGAEELKASGCDAILTVGGGSAIDTAKCIRLYSGLKLPLIVMPTTSGSGSESTHFAAIYKDGKKMSVTDESMLPDVVILEPLFLNSVPEYTRKASMLDVLCHAIESWWSRASTEESRNLSGEAIKLVLDNKDSYLANLPGGNANMLRAANLAGQAINITTTTAAHAMAYKLTSLYGLQHGHAVALCLSVIWPYLIAHNEDAEMDIRLKNLSEVYTNGETDKLSSAADEFHELLKSLKFPKAVFHMEDLPELAESVNPERLGNFPLNLSRDNIENLYLEIFKNES